MAVPRLPLGILMTLLFVAVLVGAPWKAAESALVADILAAEGYVLGTGLRLASSQAAQLAGFALGGAVVAAIGSRVALAVDAGTFALSALVLRIALAPRPAARAEREEQSGWRTGISAVVRSGRLRTLLGYAWLAGAFVVPEGLAAPYAARLGGGAGSVGLLLASMPAGTLLSALLFVRLVPRQRRSQAVPIMAAAAGLPLVACVTQPGLAPTMLLWATTGALMTYQVQVMTQFVTTAPVHYRGQAIAFASSGLLAAQGIGLLIGGACMSFASAPAVVAGAGAGGSVLAVGLFVAQCHSQF
jgi:hypothetical protein